MTGDPYHLIRFVEAQRTTYAVALAELRRGRKSSHWIWFVFPQLAGLGRSTTAQFYGLGGLGEARAYLAHPILGPRLLESVQAMLAHPDVTARQSLGDVDARKLRSCLTLFAEAGPTIEPFTDALARFFGGQRDPLTLDLLGAQGGA